MKQLLNRNLIPLVLLIVCFFFPSFLFAQAGPGGDPDVTVPVDGGLSILAAAGVAYGVKKIKEYKKKKDTEPGEAK